MANICHDPRAELVGKGFEYFRNRYIPRPYKYFFVFFVFLM